MQNIIMTAKYKVLHVAVKGKSKIKAEERKLYESNPGPHKGVLMIAAGAVLFACGLVMLVVPGPGLLAIAAGIALAVVGVRIIKGVYRTEYTKEEETNDAENVVG